MSTKKVAGTEATAPATGQETGVEASFPIPILPHIPADVKLLEGFEARHIPYADIVEVVRSAFPGFDKSLLSKCRNYRRYGVGLRSGAVKLLEDHFRIQGREGHRQPARKKPRRIQCRITEAVYGLLQRRIAQTGQNIQDYLEALILADLKGANHEQIP